MADDLNTNQVPVNTDLVVGSGSEGKLAVYRARLQARVELDENGCWRWQGPKVASRGSSTPVYGSSFHMYGKGELAHRAAYKLWVGEIPEGYTIDHLCGVKDCANPAHLEAVTAFENLRRSAGTWVGQNTRKTHCPHGHEYTPENTEIRPQSMGRPGVARFCRACAKESHKRNPIIRTAVECTSCSWSGKRQVRAEYAPCSKCGGAIIETRVAA